MGTGAGSAASTDRGHAHVAHGDPRRCGDRHHRSDRLRGGLSGRADRHPAPQILLGRTGDAAGRSGVRPGLRLGFVDLVGPGLLGRGARDDLRALSARVPACRIQPAPRRSSCRGGITQPRCGPLENAVPGDAPAEPVRPRRGRPARLPVPARRVRRVRCAALPDLRHRHLHRVQGCLRHGRGFGAQPAALRRGLAGRRGRDENRRSASRRTRRIHRPTRDPSPVAAATGIRPRACCSACSALRWAFRSAP